MNGCCILRKCGQLHGIIFSTSNSIFFNRDSINRYQESSDTFFMLKDKIIEQLRFKKNHLIFNSYRYNPLIWIFVSTLCLGDHNCKYDHASTTCLQRDWVRVLVLGYTKKNHNSFIYKINYKNKLNTDLQFCNFFY